MMLPPSIMSLIMIHAKEESPRECCGLVAVVKGKRRSFPCKTVPGGGLKVTDNRLQRVWFLVSEEDAGTGIEAYHVVC